MKVHINILEMKVGKVVWVPACKFLKKNWGGGGGGGEQPLGEQDKRMC